jgi:hypothetical protein
MDAPPRGIARYDADDSLLPAPIQQRPLAVRTRDPLGTASRVAGLLVKLTLLAILVAILVAGLSLLGVGGRTTAGLGEQIGAAIERSSGAVGNVAQTIRDATDPAHPPRGPITYDTEFAELATYRVGAEIPGAAERTIIVSRLERRTDAPAPDTAAYAVIHTELRSPRETRVLGILVRSDREPRDLFLYKGESIRVGRKLYKVNWLSLEQQQIGLAAYRQPDQVTGALKLETD